MKFLSELTAGVEIVRSSVEKEVPVMGLTQNSQKVKDGYVFIVSSPEAAKYIPEAIQKGAVALVSERFFSEAPCLVVKNVRKSAAYMARAFYSFPERKLELVGVVGTNGKTTVTQILNSLFSFCGYRTAVIGTLGVFIGSDRYENDRTTPDSAEFFMYLKECVEKKIDYVFVEVSAHAIFYQKLDGVRFGLCVFTNCTQDHLDFFGTMEKYREVKMSFFTDKNVKCAILNSDDETGRDIAFSEKVNYISYGLYNPSDVFAVRVEDGAFGTDFMVNIFDETFYVHSPLHGEFNVSNLLAAIAVCRLYGIPAEDVKRAILSLDEIEGRFNVINWRSKIIIDYAHTPDGMEKVLTCARKMCKGELICLFGCGGDRDKGKRPLMGKIATELADVTVLTCDNPRSENTEDIIADIKKGAVKEVFCVPDRREAVNMCLELSKPGDVVLLLGKGAEKYIESKGQRIPYSDDEVCIAYIGSHPCNA